MLNEWKAKVRAAIRDLEAALTTSGPQAKGYMQQAETNVLAAIDAFDDAQANEAT